MTMCRCTLAVTLLVLSQSIAVAADWPQWRGPDRSGVSRETGLLKAWPKEGPKLLWTFKNAGVGHSSCAIVGGTFYTLGTRGDDEIVIALDAAKGTELWTAKVGPIYKAFGNWGHGPRSTPTIDGDRLYALGSGGDLVCTDLKGKEVWRKNLQKDFGGEYMTELGDWAYCESPLVDGPHLFCTPGGNKGTFLCLKKADGSTVWQSKELTHKAPDSSAVVAEINGVRQYIQDSYVDTVGGFVSGVAAKDGKVLWTAPMFKGACYNISPTPIVSGNLVYVTTNMAVSGCHCFEIDKAMKPKDLYKANQKVMKNNHGGVVLVGDHVYGHCDKVGWVCQELKTGSRAWEQREFVSGTKSGAITAADGMLYLFSDEGEVGLAEASPAAFKGISSFALPERSKLQATLATAKDSRPWAHPVISGGRLFLRDHELIFCYDVKAKN